MVRSNATTLLSIGTATMAFASLASAASVQTYDFACYGSRVGTTYSARSSSDAWVGSFSSLTDDNNNNNDVDPFACAPLGFGLAPNDARTTPILESEQSIQQLQNHWIAQGATDLSVELWFSPPSEPLQKAAPIFTIGQTSEDAAAATGYIQHGNCEGYDVRISQLDESRLEFSFRDDGPFRACRGASISIPPTNPLLDDSSLTQLVVVLGKQGLSIFINGQIIHEKIRIQFLGTLVKWNPRYRMQLVSNHLNEDPDADFYPGSIHQLSLYDYALESQSAPALYLGGLQTIRDAAKTKTAPPRPVPSPSPTTRPNGSGEEPTEGSSSPPAGGGAATLPPVDNTIPPIPGIPTLVATPNGTYSIPQGQTSPFSITLQGLSSISPEDSDGWWSLKMEVLSVTQFGILTLAADKTPIEAGDLLALELLVPEAPTDDIFAEPEALPTLLVSVDYTLQSTSYFNVPRVSATGEDLGVSPEAFEYRILAIDNISKDVLASSVTVRQPVHVLHVNQPSKLSTAMKSLEWSDEPDFSLFGNRPVAYFSDSIVLQDPVDRKVDRVRVDVFATNGTFTLNEEHRHLAEFESCRNRDYSPWQCSGNGVDNQIMTFMAYPSDVELILSDMQYKGYYNEPDELVIRVFDGVGENCLSQQEHATYIDEVGRQFSSIYDGQCQQAQLVFEMEPLEGSGVPEADPGKYFAQTLTIFIAVILVICCAGGSISYCAFGRHKASTGNKVYPEDKSVDGATDSDGSVVVVDQNGQKEDTEETLCNAV